MAKPSNVPEIPLKAKILVPIFPLYELVAPKSANQFIVDMFLTPLSFPIPEEEVSFKLKADIDSFPFQGEELMTYSWGNPSHKTVFMMHGWAGRATQFRFIIDALVNSNLHVIAMEGPGHNPKSSKKTNVVEFATALSAFLKDKEIFAAVGHSLGALALLYAIENFNLKPQKLVTTSAPTIAKDVIDIYRKKINATKKAHKAIDRFVMNKMNKPFAYFSGIEIAKRLQEKAIRKHLIIHDKNDREAPIYHARELHKVLPHAELFETQTLGHVRLLKDAVVIKRVVNFLNS